MIADNILILFPVISFLIYVPILCYLDIKEREVEHWVWLPLVIPNAILLAYMHYINSYPWYSFVISLIMCGIFFYCQKRELIGGADFIYLCCISLFFVVNPFPYPHGLMQIPFYIYIMIAMAVTALATLAYNYISGNRWTVFEMMSRYPRGIPFMLPISVAFLLTLELG